MDYQMGSIFLELAKAGVNVAAKELFTRVIRNWGSHNLLGRQIVRSLSSENIFINYQQNHVSRVVRLRTIHNADYDIFLQKIYHPLTISSTDAHSGDLVICDNFIINDQSINNIIGTAGQGKSTILRKLFLETLRSGDKVPFFLELRKIEGVGVLQGFKDILSNLEIRTEDKDLEELLSSNKIVLMLDGFDEISLKHRDNILNEINALNHRYSVQIITTSRPGTPICHEPFIVNYKVQDLKEKDILAIIEKLNHNDSGIDAEQLPKINAIISNNKNLISVMRTPILVTLFHVCYPFMDIIPKNTVEFYSSLFMTLYLRHDKIKNFEREKSAALSHNEAYECFCALCFHTLYENTQDFNHTKFLKYTENALRIKNKIENCKPEDLLSDLLNITCMIQKDGYDRYVFIHKSIQEYHAAEFIKSISSDLKVKFYNVMIDDIKTKSYRYNAVISFLMEIDEINTAKHFTLPLCEYYKINHWGQFTPVELKDLYLKVFSETIISVKYNAERVRAVNFQVNESEFDWLSLYFPDFRFVSPLYDEVHNLLVHTLILSGDFFRNHSKAVESERNYTVPEIARLCDFESKILQNFGNLVTEIYSKVYLENINKVKNESLSIQQLFDL